MMDGGLTVDWNRYRVGLGVAWDGALRRNAVDWQYEEESWRGMREERVWTSTYHPSYVLHG